MVKLGNRELSAEDFLRIQEDPRVRTFLLPHGAKRGEKQRVLGRTAPWSGKHGEDFIAEAKLHGNLLKGLKACRDMSIAHKGIFGGAYVKCADGVIRWMPRKSYEQAKEAHPEYYELVTPTGTRRPWTRKYAKPTGAVLTIPA